MYSRFDLTEARKKEETYRLLKKEFEGAVRDEQEAIDKYTNIINDAERGGCREFMSEVRGIQSQEKTHKAQFQRMTSDVDRKAVDLKRQIDDEQRKKDEDRKKREEEQRRTKSI